MLLIYKGILTVTQRTLKWGSPPAGLEVKIDEFLAAAAKENNSQCQSRISRAAEGEMQLPPPLQAMPQSEFNSGLQQGK